jgi:hypothetical protein
MQAQTDASLLAKNKILTARIRKNVATFAIRGGGDEANSHDVGETPIANP